MEADCFTASSEIGVRYFLENVADSSNISGRILYDCAVRRGSQEGVGYIVCGSTLTR